MFHSCCRRLLLTFLLPVVMASGAFADGIDCRNYTTATDQRCLYSIIENFQGIQLFVVEYPGTRQEPREGEFR